MPPVWPWFVHFLGVDFGVPYGHWIWYNFWSGFGSDLQEFSVLGAVGAIYLKINCHQQGCPRIGRFPAIEGQGWHYCKTHHTTNGIHT